MEANAVSCGECIGALLYNAAVKEQTHFRLAAATSASCRLGVALKCVHHICGTVPRSTCSCPSHVGRETGASVLLATPSAYVVDLVRAHQEPISISIDELVTFYLSSSASSIDTL